MRGQLLRPLGHTIPIKQIILQEFEFIRNNPVASTIGGAALGGALVHDYHKSGAPGIANHIGNKMDTAKNWIHSVTGKEKSSEPGHTDPSTGSGSILDQAHEHM